MAMRTDKFMVDALIDRYPGRFPTLEEYETNATRELLRIGMEEHDGLLLIGTDQEIQHETDIYALIEWCIEQDRKDRAR